MPPEVLETAAPIVTAGAEPTTPSSPFSQASFRQPLTPSSRCSRDSLISNRPAPLSPEVSRRTSSALSTGSVRSRSGKSSRPPSTTLSPANSSRMNSRQSFQLALATSQAAASSTSTRRPRSLIVRVRDFAFPPGDERHEGLGPDVPRPNRARALNRHRSGRSVSSVASSDGEEDETADDVGEDDGWGGFKWGSFSWAPGRAGGYVPSSTDFARNFGAGGTGSPESEDATAGESGELDDEEDEDEERFLLGDDPLYPGLYRAMYGFVPESASEMALEEDQVVRVVGRGGGVGWAVVVRAEEEGGGHALVPEGYLEVVRLDDEREGEGEAPVES